MSKRIYSEELNEHFYRESLANWEGQQVSKRGDPPEPPVHPKWYREQNEYLDESSTTIAPDIDDIVDVEES